MMEPGTGSYSFASQPQAVRSRGKFREQAESPQTGADGRNAINIMWDRRVVRGNTYAAQVLPAAAMQGEGAVSPTSGRPPKFSGHRRGERSPNNTDEIYEAPLIESMLEEITDRPIEMVTMATTQRARSADRPPSPVFVPQVRGVDVATQVEDDDLFDFDTEVEPLLQVLVGSTLEKSLAEVIEELDLEEELQARDVFELVRVSERLECERVELANVRKQKERDRRAEQNEAHVAEEAKAKSKSTASVFAHTYVGDVVTDVFDNLEGAGFFFDPLLREIEETFLPWLAEGVHATILAAQDNEKAMSQVVADTVALQAERRTAADEEYKGMVAAQEAAERARQAEEARLAEEAAAAAAAAAAAENVAADADAPQEGVEGEGAAE